MIYFDNAATGGRKPDAVISAVSSAVKLCANPGRSGHKLSLACAAVVQNCRSALSDYFNGWGFERVIFTKNCTEALNIAIFGVLRKGDHVVTTCMEHNSVLRPLERLKKSGVITYDVCPMTDGNISPERFASLIKPDTKMAIVTSASNVTGAIPPFGRNQGRYSRKRAAGMRRGAGRRALPPRYAKDGHRRAGFSGTQGYDGDTGQRRTALFRTHESAKRNVRRNGKRKLLPRHARFLSRRLRGGHAGFSRRVLLLRRGRLSDGARRRDPLEDSLHDGISAFGFEEISRPSASIRGPIPAGSSPSNTRRSNRNFSRRNFRKSIPSPSAADFTAPRSCTRRSARRKTGWFASVFPPSIIKRKSTRF